MVCTAGVVCKFLSLEKGNTSLNKPFQNDKDHTTSTPLECMANTLYYIIWNSIVHQGGNICKINYKVTEAMCYMHTALQQKIKKLTHIKAMICCAVTL